MSINWEEIKTKVLATVLSAAVIAFGSATWYAATWIDANVVLASELEQTLEGLAEMVALEVRAELAPVKAEIQETNRLARENAEDIRRVRVDATRQAMRDLSIQIETLQQRRNSGGPWTQSDETLLGIWEQDLADLEETLEDLTGVPRIP